MGLTKCPRCELNYILDGGELCSVCSEEVRGMHSTDDSVLLCSVCGELPALPGQDMCKACLIELRSIDILQTDNEEDEAAVETDELKPDPISGLDEMEEVDEEEEEAEEGSEEELEIDEKIIEEAIGENLDIEIEFDPLENEEDEEQ